MPPVKKKKPPLDYTIDAKIVSALRLLWLRSRERAVVLKRDKHTCSCGAKASVAKGHEVKVEVHHVIGSEGRDINWKKIIDVLREELLCPPEMLISVCKPCHYKIHGKVLKPKRGKK